MRSKSQYGPLAQDLLTNASKCPNTSSPQGLGVVPSLTQIASTQHLKTVPVKLPFSCAVLGGPEGLWPIFTSSFVFELWEGLAGSSHVRVLYDRKPFHVPGGTSGEQRRALLYRRCGHAFFTCCLHMYMSLSV